MLVPDLRPLSVGEIIDVAIKIWRRHLATLARIVFVVVAPVEILSALVAASVSTSEIETFDAAGNPTVDGGALAAWAAGMFTAQVLSGLAFLIASAAVLRAVSVAYLGGTPDWKESLRAATARLRSLIWLGFLLFAGMAGAALALLLPAIWLGVAWSLAFPVLIAEGQRGAPCAGPLLPARQGPLVADFRGAVPGLPVPVLPRPRPGHPPRPSDLQPGRRLAGGAGPHDGGQCAGVGHHDAVHGRRAGAHLLRPAGPQGGV